MPKGDRLKLKADPEDGTTPIANLLLEAVAMAKLSGLQKGAILHLWRKTYGWVDESGKRRKEASIGLKEWTTALDAIKSSVATALSELVQKNIIIRNSDAWQTYNYQINTNIADWNSGCIDHDKLRESIQLSKSVQYELKEQSKTEAQLVNTERTVIQNRTLQLSKTVPPTLYKEIIKKDKEKDDDLKTIIKNESGEKVKEVFYQIDKRRGYRPPKRKAEASSIIRMLKTYTTDQIIETWQKLKSEQFWQKKELYMMSVESQIGAIVNGTNQSNTQANGDAERNTPENSKYTTGKYGQFVKH
jgi:phage replication O-like protein O